MAATIDHCNPSSLKILRKELVPRERSINPINIIKSIVDILGCKIFKKNSLKPAWNILILSRKFIS